jgi:hypothetical protein
MIVSINQPAYLPWLGYFDRICRSDLHIVLDHVQFEKNSMVNRNRIRTPADSQMLTVPVQTAGRFGDIAINDMEIFNQGNWARKHWQAIRQNYSKSAYFSAHHDFLADTYARTWRTLNEPLRHLTGYLLTSLGIGTRILYSSDLQVRGKRQDLIMNLCRHVEATTYISGPLGRNYLDSGQFKAAGITLLFHDYQHPVYPQCYPGFESHMSIIDLLFNCGVDSRTILLTEPSLTAATA